MATLPLAIAASIIISSNTAAASHDGLECSTPDSLEPLFQLLHSLGELAFLAGITVGTLGFLIAGICLMLPGEDYNRRGKMVAKNVFIGVVLLLSSNMIVSYLTVQMGGTACV